MPLIRPFRGLCPDAVYASEVIAPPYDVLTSAEARARAAGHPRSFLHVSKPEIDLPLGTPVTDPGVYAQGATAFREMIEQSVLRQDESDRFYIYRMNTDGGHQQTGLVTTVSVVDYEGQRIRRHELTRPDKEDDRVRHMQALGAQTGPVLLVHRDNEQIEKQLRELSKAPAAYANLSLDSVKHSLWPVTDSAAIQSLQELYMSIDTFYIADGHHRSAAAARVAQERNAGPNDTAAYFLAVLFPAAQMRILDYNRVVTDLNGASTDRFLDLLREAFAVTRETQAVRPQHSGEFGLYLEANWYRLELNMDLQNVSDDQVMQLDVTRLSRYVLEPLLDIHDPRRDPRIDFVGGGRGLEALQQRVDSGEMAAAFSMFPTPLSALMEVADAGEIMPPKSTWFEPKLADGLVSHMLDT